MQTKATIEPRGLPVRGIMPEPVRVHADSAAAPRPDDDDGDQHDQIDVVVRRRDPASILVAKVLSVIRGDKYMVDAYEPAWSALGARRAGATVVGAQRRDVGAAAHSVAASEPAVAAAAEPEHRRPEADEECAPLRVGALVLAYGLARSQNATHRPMDPSDVP